MCGVCGIVRLDQQVRSAEVESMKNALVHRGPDDEGTYIDSVDFAGRKGAIGLGHRRLSIIDLSKNARQPMSNEDGRIWLTYNGEIYNFAELKDELVSCGHVFKTKSDSEVIIHGYEQWGVDCLSRFNGMFSFAVWDRDRKSLFLARDRLGIKPLYYYHKNNTFLFASELKALIQAEAVPKEIDFESVNDYLSLQFIPAPRTIFKGIKKVLPACYAVFDDKGLRLQKYWSRQEQVSVSQSYSDHEYEEQIREILRSSVEKRMISDVPLGAFLSGGVDSSAIVSLMAARSGQPVKTFSIGFDSQEYESELEFARITAKTFKTDHHEEILSVHTLIGLLPELVYCMDEPFADHSMVPTFLVSQLARKHVTVALSGDGGDENFAGYPRRYLFAKRYDSYARVPRPVRRVAENILSGIISVVPSSAYASSPNKKLGKVKDMLDSEGIGRIAALHAIMNSGLKRRVLAPAVLDLIPSLQSLATVTDEQRKGSTYLKQILSFDIENYLPNDILTKVDRMSMAHSLEVRVPLLDHRLVELAHGIPVAKKILGDQTKYIFKKSFKAYLPQEIIQRKKQGFGVPIAFWMRKDLMAFTKEVLLDDSVKKRGIFNTDTVEAMVRMHSLRKAHLSRELWALLIFELWCKRFLD